MKDIDFLPGRYREQDAVRKSQLWQVTVVLLFGGVVTATAMFQYALRRSVQHQLLEVEAQMPGAEARHLRLADLQSQLQRANQLASLYTYLQHPWPRTRILAELAAPLPLSVTLSEIRATREPLEAAPLSRGLAETSEQQAQAAQAPAERDLQQMRDEWDKTRTIVQVSGYTTDSAALHGYVASLGNSSFFAKAELASLESIGDSSGPLALSSEASRFDLKIILRPGYGHPQGPRPTAANADAALTAAVPLEHLRP